MSIRCLLFLGLAVIICGTAINIYAETVPSNSTKISSTVGKDVCSLEVKLPKKGSLYLDDEKSVCD